MDSECRTAELQQFDTCTTTTTISSSSNGAAAGLRGRRAHPPQLQLGLGAEDGDRVPPPPATCTAYGPSPLSTSGGGGTGLPDGWPLPAFPHSCRSSTGSEQLSGGSGVSYSTDGSGAQKPAAWLQGRRAGRQSSRPSMLRLDGSSTGAAAAHSSSAASSTRRRSSVKAASSMSGGGGGDSAARRCVGWGVNGSSRSGSGSGSGSTAGGRAYGTSWFLPTQDWGQAARAAPGSTWSRESVHIERMEQQHEVARHLGLLEEDGDPCFDAAALQLPALSGIVSALAAAAAEQAHSPRRRGQRTSRLDSASKASTGSTLVSPAASCRCSSGGGQGAGVVAAPAPAANSRPPSSSSSSSSSRGVCDVTAARLACAGAAAVLLPPKSARGSLPSTPLATAAAAVKAPQQSKLGSAPQGAPRSLMDLCLGRHGAAAAPSQHDMEVEQAALAAADEAYMQQLHVLAAHQAQLQAQLRDTFVLKAYKEFLRSRGLRQPACLRRLPTPTQLDLHAAERRRRAQQLREQQALERRRSLTALTGSRGSSSGGAVRKRVTQEEQQQQQQPGEALLNLYGTSAAAAAAAGGTFAAVIAAAASAGVSLPSRCAPHHASKTPKARSSSGSGSSSSSRQRVSRLQQRCHGLTHRRDASEQQQEQLQEQLQASLEPNSLAADECRLLAALLTGGRAAAAAAVVEAIDTGAAAVLPLSSCRGSGDPCKPPACSCSSSSSSEADDADDAGFDWDAIDLAEPSAACAVKAPADASSSEQHLQEQGPEPPRHHQTATLRNLLLAPAEVNTSLNYCLTSRSHRTGGSSTHRATPVVVAPR